ncbi:MAG: carbohydrate binding domain-containing protein [Alistipes sp.]|nr:carbohydrate binding domain-containing protein [Alistipes sp.]
MKNGFFKKIVTGMLGGLMCLTMLPQVQLSSSAANVGDKLSVGNGTTQHKGNCDGYSYEVWIDTTGGSGSMTLGEGASFTAEWNASVSSGNFLARRGLDFGSQKKATDYPYIGLDYEADYRQTGSASGNSRLCVYGWFQNKNAGNVPLVEYYIIEDWVDWCPDADGKMVTIDGAQYKIFQMDHTGPTINGGSETFKQYFSVRQQKRTSGHITVSDHFKAWADEGWGIGNLYEVALNAEGWQSSGVADVKKLDVYTDPDNRDPNIGVGGDTPDTPAVEPDANGNYFYCPFESGTDSWSGRGDAEIALDSKNYYAGSKSLAVTGRTDNWHGAAISLDSDAFVPGNTYSFSTAVLQESGESTNMKLTLQYSLDGEDNYKEVASADVTSGVWTKLENTSFTIPSGASNLILYVEAPDSLTDFCIDEARGAVVGTKSDVVTGSGTVGSGSVTPPVTTAPPTVVTTQPPTTAKAPVTENIAWGDANCDGSVDIADATLILQYIGNSDKYKLTEQGMKNADVYEAGGGITAMDSLAIQKYDAGVIKSLPESYSDSWSGGNTTVTDNPVQNPSEGKYFSNSFDTSTEGWTGRGDASIALNSDNYYSGKSLSISGRTDNWNGAAIELDTKTFVPGNAYSFSAAVLQKSGAAETVQMTLQYTLDGEDNYDQIAAVTANSGEWTKLEKTSFTIPEGAADLLMYIEMPDSLADFYVDEVQTAAEGTKSTVVTGGGFVSDVSTAAPVVSGGVDISWIDPTKPMVAISFDDGASPETGTRIVDALSDSGFHATFFYVGDWIRDTNGENEVKYAYSNGMEIANHTKSHPDLTTKSAAEIRNEYDQCATKLKGIIGAEPSKLLRLPYLGCNSTVQSTLSDVPLITCAIDTQDWNGASKDQIVNTIKSAMSNGSLNGAIVLAHETYDTTASAMEELCPYLKAQGWQIVTVSEMFAVKNQQMNGGQVYTKVN